MLLEDIFDTIVPDESIIYKEEFTETLLHMMEEYVIQNPTSIAEPDFHDTFIEEIQELVISQFSQELWDNDETELEYIIEEVSTLFYVSFMPPRSYPSSIILHPPEIDTIKKQIDYLCSIPQPTQRTNEWYEFRHNLITASNAYKAFGSDCTINQLIFEKCKPMQEVSSSSNSNSTVVNVDTTLHWGQKYEPVSVMIYENMYNTTIQDFGCIQHSEYHFLGASPDGINVDVNNLRYGRMLEIKNIVNREIDGIPKLEYWIQMQLQMETCNLDECDFLETKFTEYATEAEYDADVYAPEQRGIIMYFSNPHLYVYAPLNISKDEFEVWELEMMEKHSEKTWIRNIFWKAEHVSCVLVVRNKIWFRDAIKTLEMTWNKILDERITGHEHRAPMKRVSSKASPSSSGERKCLLNINYETGKIDLINKVIKIRTESFDMEL